MKHLVSALALAVLAAAPVAASAGSITVTFEKNWDYLNGGVGNYYSGGSAADGSKGPNLGVSFVNISGLSNDSLQTYFSGAPSPLGVAYVFGTGAFINLASGFRNISFSYSSFDKIDGAVKAYSGLNGGGDFLGSINILANDSNSSGLYDTFSVVSMAFGGAARSFDFSALANANVAFDNVTFVPEPGVLLLLATGGALAFARRKKIGR